MRSLLQNRAIEIVIRHSILDGRTDAAIDWGLNLGRNHVDVSLSEFALGLEPIVEVMAVLTATFLESLVGAQRNGVRLGGAVIRWAVVRHL